MVGEHNIKSEGSSHLVFWVELGLELVVMSSGGPSPDGALARGYSGTTRKTLRYSNNLQAIRAAVGSSVIERELVGGVGRHPCSWACTLAAAHDGSGSGWRSGSGGRSTAAVK
jgi:hypothetical protein